MKTTGAQSIRKIDRMTEDLIAHIVERRAERSNVSPDERMTQIIMAVAKTTASLIAHWGIRRDIQAASAR